MGIGPIKFPPVRSPTATPTPSPTPTPTPAPAPSPTPTPTPSPPPAPAPAPATTYREAEVQARPSYPGGTLFGSIRQRPAGSPGWNIVADDETEESKSADDADPALTAAAIMKDALAAMVAQANVDRQGALTLLLR